MEKMDKILKEWIVSLCIALIIMFLLYNIIWPVKVDGDSMYSTIKDGDYIFVSKLLVMLKPIKLGDLIVVNYEEDGKKEKIVKRIIGTEGDHIVIKNGNVTVNAKVLEEPYTTSETSGDIDLYVPEDSYFILGDNRTISKDSRIFGCIYKENIWGRILFK